MGDFDVFSLCLNAHLGINRPPSSSLVRLGSARSDSWRRHPLICAPLADPESQNNAPIPVASKARRRPLGLCVFVRRISPEFRRKSELGYTLYKLVVSPYVSPSVSVSDDAKGEERTGREREIFGALSVSANLCVCVRRRRRATAPPVCNGVCWPPRNKRQRVAFSRRCRRRRAAWPNIFKSVVILCRYDSQHTVIERRVSTR